MRVADGSPGSAGSTGGIGGPRWVDPIRPVFDHLAVLTDERGLFEHARFATPRTEHGYCVDDAARGLLVTAREPHPDAEVLRLHACYLSFVVAAVTDDGRCHNRMDPSGRWSDAPALGDWWGRALWGLGVAAARSASAGARGRALSAFRLAAQQRSPHLRATAFSALGAADVLTVRPAEPAARAILDDFVVDLRGRPAVGSWPWPEARLSYANAALAEALIVAGDATGDSSAVTRGLELLGFLLRMEVRDDRLSVSPVGGRGPDDPGPQFDQQPIEVAALADACASAYRITGDSQWQVGVELAWRWFLGANDVGTLMFDPVTGGGFDGLEAGGRNANQGAESTLALLSTAQQARAVRSPG